MRNLCPLPSLLSLFRFFFEVKEAKIKYVKPSKIRTKTGIHLPSNPADNKLRKIFTLNRRFTACVNSNTMIFKGKKVGKIDKMKIKKKCSMIITKSTDDVH
jgi:hypothetical protein